MSVQETIKSHDKSHGSYPETARISQELKFIMFGTKNWLLLEPHQRESLELIALKVARILSGNHEEPDHWHDIAGYAVLVENEICKI